MNQDEERIRSILHSMNSQFQDRLSMDRRDIEFLCLEALKANEYSIALKTAHEIFGFESNKLGAEIERLKEEMDSRQKNYTQWAVKLQSDLAAHALALKEAREVIALADYVIKELGDGDFDEDSHEAAVLSIHKNTIKAFLSRPLSSYQQRVEKLEVVAKAAQRLKDTGAWMPHIIYDALSDLDKE